MVVSIILFAVAAIGGALMAIMRLRGRPRPPLALALVHGGVAAAGLVFLILSVVNGSVTDIARIALVVFIVAALGGFVLFSFHLRKKPLPVALVLGHGLIAVVGFVLLLKGFLG